jgi:putative hydrolase of the HAD superfamily
MISVVLFDLFETLVTESTIQPTRASSLAAALGLEERAYRAEWKKRRPLIVRGEMSFIEALTGICGSLAGRVDGAAINRIREQRVQEKAIVYARIHSGVASVISKLADRGIALAVVSNGFEEDVLGWPSCSLAPRFERAVFSCRERVAKPDPEIYLRALGRLRVNPSAAMYIGDGADDELTGAERAGLQVRRAAWFVGEGPRHGSWPALETPEDVLKLFP